MFLINLGANQIKKVSLAMMNMTIREIKILEVEDQINNIEKNQVYQL